MKSKRALPLYRLAIQKRPDWAGQILPNIWFHDPNAEELLARAIPPLPGPRLALLKLLADHGQWTSAEVVWRRHHGERSIVPVERCTVLC